MIHKWIIYVAMLASFEMNNFQKPLLPSVSRPFLQQNILWAILKEKTHHRGYEKTTEVQLPPGLRKRKVLHKVNEVGKTKIRQ